MLANRHVMKAYSTFERGPVRLQPVPSYRAGDGSLTRALAMARAAVCPRRAARAVPAGLDLVHYAVTVPIPSTSAPRVVTLHDVQHRDLPHLFSRAERTFRRWAYDGSARRAQVVVTSSHFSKQRIVETSGSMRLQGGRRCQGVERRRFHPDAEPGDPAALGDLRLPAPLRSVSGEASSRRVRQQERLLEALGIACQTNHLDVVLTGGGAGGLEHVRMVALASFAWSAASAILATSRPKLSRRFIAVQQRSCSQAFLRGIRLAATRSDGLRVSCGRFQSSVASGGMRYGRFALPAGLR